MASMKKPSLTVVKPKPAKALKAKKPAADPKIAKTHPPYAEMINDAIVTLKERTGSSQIAIAKFIEEKQKDLPSNFKKQLLVQLKKLVAAGKLVKIKHSFKLAAVVKQTSSTATGTVAVKKASAPPAKKKVASVSKPKGAATSVKVKKVAAAKPKVVKKPKKVAKTATVVSPGKKRVDMPVAKARKVVVKVVKKPKSIKSPVKKVTAKGKK